MIVITEAKMLPYPSKCISCGTNQEDCVNFVGITQQWNGALLICLTCMRHVISSFPQQFPFVPLSEYHSVLGELENANVRETAFESALEEFKDALDAARDRFDSHLGAAVPVGVSDDAPVENDEGSAPATKSPAFLDL